MQDLHAITPAEYLEFGDAVVHALSYQMARHLNMPVRGVYVANPGYTLGAAGVPRGAVIESVGGQPVATLAEFEAAIAALPDGGRAALRYKTLDDPRGTPDARRCAWTGAGSRRSTAAATTRAATGPAASWRRRRRPGPSRRRGPRSSPRATRSRTGSPRRWCSSISTCRSRSRASPSATTTAPGVIVDATRGLVAVDRNTVPVAVGDVRITVAGSVEVPGRVEYVHPLHNLALVSFDPALLDGTPIRAAKLDPRELGARGVRAPWSGCSGDSRVRALATTVSSVEGVDFPLSRTLRFRESNLEVASLVNAPTDFDGVIAGRDGRVRALWSSFATEAGRDFVQVNRAIGAELVVEMVETLRSGEPLYSLEAEFESVSISAARKLGLDDAWVARLESLDGTQRQALRVARVIAGSPAADAAARGRPAARGGRPAREPAARGASA